MIIIIIIVIIIMIIIDSDSDTDYDNSNAAMIILCIYVRQVSRFELQNGTVQWWRIMNDELLDGQGTGE
jgi:hypothetical protein